MNDIVRCYELSLSLSVTHLMNLYVCDVVNVFSLGIFNFSSSVHMICVVMGDSVALKAPQKEYPYYYYYYYYYYYNIILYYINITSNIMINYNRQDKKL